MTASVPEIPVPDVVSAMDLVKRGLGGHVLDYPPLVDIDPDTGHLLWLDAAGRRSAARSGPPLSRRRGRSAPPVRGVLK